MNENETAGVAALGRILARMASGDTPSVGALVAEEPIARSTAFAVVGRMAEAGLIKRGAHGELTPGNAAGAYAFAAFKLAPLYGSADPILAWLRDETNARVELQACDGASYQTLIRFSTLQPKHDGGPIIAPLRLGGAEVARVRLTRSVESLDIAQCNASMASVVVRLEELLGQPPDDVI